MYRAIGVIIVLIIGAVVLAYVAVAVAGVAAIGGAIYGSGTAIRNYVSSFRENMVDSNRISA